MKKKDGKLLPGDDGYRSKKKHSVPTKWRVANLLHNAMMQRRPSGLDGSVRLRIDGLPVGVAEFQQKLKNCKSVGELDRLVKYFQKEQIHSCRMVIQNAIKVAEIEADMCCECLTLRELVEEIDSLQEVCDRFGAAVSFDRDNIRGLFLVITTEPIELEDDDGSGRVLPVGDFELLLHKENMQYTNPSHLMVEALNPNTSANGEYWHPHVTSGGDICFGAHEPAIKAAYLEGRLTLLVELILLVLHGYYGDGAYRRIEDWDEDGAIGSCAGCGESVYEESDYVTCAECEDTLHDSCGHYCDQCSEYYCYTHYDQDERCCHGCLVRCDGCRRHVHPDKMTDSSDLESYCSDCVADCATCGKITIADELNENGLCQSCVEEENEREEEENDDVQEVEEERFEISELSVASASEGTELTVTVLGDCEGEGVDESVDPDLEQYAF